MLTSIRISNFKKFTDTDIIPLDKSVVFIGPNNSGKTTALQALSLWYLGVNKWLEKRGEKSVAKKNTGVAINRKDIYSIPTPNAKYLWNNLATKTKKSEKILIQVFVEGISEGIEWKCGLAFDYFGEEVLYCRPITTLQDNIILTQPELLRKTKVAFLPPMSGLVPQEAKLLSSAVNARIGEGRTAEVLRNLCYFILHPEVETQINGKLPQENWKLFTDSIKELFGIEVKDPQLNDRGEIEQTYIDLDKNELDLSSSGRGLQQVMLLLAYMLANPRSILLLDEPDAHLEILRQRVIYNTISNWATQNGSQIIAASHSEVVLQEAANKDTVIAFVGKPHKINDKGSQVMKSLTTIGFENYYLAELRKWVLYVEGSTDLSILRSFAKILNHPVEDDLADAFVHYVATNLPNRAREHFHGLRDAVPKLKGIAIFDRIDTVLDQNEKGLVERMWQRREIENYVFKSEVLIRFAIGTFSNDLFGVAESETRKKAMQKSIRLIVPQIALDDLNDQYWTNDKASEQLERIFREYFKEIDAYNVMGKNRFFELADMMTKDEIPDEIHTMLDLIYKVSSSIK
jgi:AAA15 family ATPase/GTPase